MDRLEFMEPPFTGIYYIFDSAGDFLCIKCHNKLFTSENKFHSGSGWASFDDCYIGSLTIHDSKVPGKKVCCAKCGNPVGRFFTGENFTPTNQRFDVSSQAITFVPFIK